jgi:hypothetical protein
MFTVGSRVLLGGGRVGLGPMPAESGNFAASPHPARLMVKDAAKAASPIKRLACMNMSTIKGATN